jgi:hypothetical protein
VTEARELGRIEDDVKSEGDLGVIFVSLFLVGIYGRV